MSAQVLIADDEALIRQSLRTTLAREGFDVTVAASGAEAWLRFREDRPDIVLLDLVLGDADGLELLRRMRQEAPGHQGHPHLGARFDRERRRRR